MTRGEGLRGWGIPLVALGAFFLVTSFFLAAHTPDQVEYTGGIPIACGSLIHPGTQASNAICDTSLDRHRSPAIAFGAAGAVVMAGGGLLLWRTRRSDPVAKT